MTIFDLRSLKVRVGEEHREPKEIELEPVDLAGQRYLPVPDTVTADFAATRANSGVVFELRFRTRLHGPCFRCLADAVLDLPIRSREYQDSRPEGDEELTTPYLVDDRLDLSAWAHDAVVLGLPVQILCRPDCAGLCPVCGKDLNLEPHVHEEEESDPRWAELAKLREQL
jgi:uncharacterized protein